MARLQGWAGTALIDATTPADPTGVTSWELDYKADVIDVTGMDSNSAKEFIAGCTEATVTLELFSTGVPDTEWLPGATILFQLRYHHDDAGAWHGAAIVTDMKPSVTVEGAVKMSISAQVTATSAAGAAVTFHYATP